MDAETANKNRSAQKARGRNPALILPARQRKDANGAVIGVFDVRKFPKGQNAELHFGMKNPKDLNFFVWCFTHKKGAFCATRHQATFGAFKTSAQDKRTEAQKLESTVKGHPCPSKWCSGCVADFAAV